MSLLDRIETRAPWAAGVLFALPCLVARYPPMTDLALHEAVISVLRHFHDPAYYPPGLYQLNLGHPNQLFYLVAWALSYAVGTTWALKIVVAASEVALYVSASHLAKHLGTPRWTALLVGVLGYGWMFYWGLLANMIGLAAFLWVIPTLDAFVKAPSWRGGVWSFAALLLLYAAHETVMLCACLMMGMFALGYGALRPAFLARVTPAVAATACGVLNLWRTQKLRPPVNASLPTVFQPLSHKIEVLPGVLFAGYEVYIRHIMFGVTLCAIALFAADRWRERRALGGWRGARLGELYLRYRFELFAASLFAGYLVLPFTLSGATLFYHRFLPPAYAILAVALAPRADAAVRSPLPRLAAAIAPIGSLLIAWPSFADSNKVASDLEALVQMTEYDQAVMIVDVGHVAHRLFSQTPLEGHVTAMRGGRSLFDFTRSPIAPAFMNPEYAWDDPYRRMQTKPILMRPEHDLDRFRYVYFHSPSPDLNMVAAIALEPDARLVATRGEWSLFESTHLKMGLLAPDDQLPYPRPHTLRKRMKDVIRLMTGEPIPPETVQEPPPGWSGPPLALKEPPPRAKPQLPERGAASERASGDGTLDDDPQPVDLRP